MSMIDFRLVENQLSAEDFLRLKVATVFGE